MRLVSYASLIDRREHPPWRAFIYIYLNHFQRHSKIGELHTDQRYTFVYFPSASVLERARAQKLTCDDFAFQQLF
jgi:hypothetical protein